MVCDACEIKNLLYTYADRIDRGDLEGVADMFTHANLINRGASGEKIVLEGREGALATYRNFTRLYEDNGTPHTKHVTTNVIVEVDDSGVAASTRAYAVVFQAVDDFPLQPIIGVRYYDRFEKIDGKWRFSEREIESDLFGDLSRHLLQPHPPHG